MTALQKKGAKCVQKYSQSVTVTDCMFEFPKNSYAGATAPNEVVLRGGAFQS